MLLFSPAGAHTTGAVVGHEWKSLVESSMTSQNAQQQQQIESSGRRDSPVSMTQHGSTGSLTNANTSNNYSSNTAVAATKAPSGSIDAANEEDLAKTAAQARFHNVDLKVDVLRELEDVANMTISETGFFCK